MRISDWSSDVCSSDLDVGARGGEAQPAAARVGRCGRTVPPVSAVEVAHGPCQGYPDQISPLLAPDACRSEEHTSELQSLMRISYAVFCLKKKTYIATHSKVIRHTNDKRSEAPTTAQTDTK